MVVETPHAIKLTTVSFSQEEAENKNIKSALWQQRTNKIQSSDCNLYASKISYQHNSYSEKFRIKIFGNVCPSAF